MVLIIKFFFSSFETLVLKEFLYNKNSFLIIHSFWLLYLLLFLRLLFVLYFICLKSHFLNLYFWSFISLHLTSNHFSFFWRWSFWFYFFLFIIPKFTFFIIDSWPKYWVNRRKLWLLLCYYLSFCLFN